MAIVTIFSASNCGGEEVSRRTAQALGYKYVGDEFLQRASERYPVSRKELEDALHARSSFLEKLSGDRRARKIPYIKAAFAEEVRQDNILYHGFAGHLLPKGVSHVLRVCLLADRNYRIGKAVEKAGISEEEAGRIVQKDDKERLRWTEHLFELGPWDASLYDIVIPMHERSVEEAVGIIVENARKDALRTTARSSKEIDDLVLAAQVHAALSQLRHDVKVVSDGGNIEIAVLKFTWWWAGLQERLEKKASGVPGVKSVCTVRGATYYPDRYRDELKLPRKILLVDDEKEFVGTLSERLQARSMESVVAYDGEEALALAEKDRPDVMVLDLKMPGIDGMEVLRRIKKEQPATEVIILTGHGSEKDKALAEELGAFAYLEKPVDIDLLTKVMKEAYQKSGEEKRP